MVHMAPGNIPGLPVEQLAQFLLGCARDDPALLSRSNIDSLDGANGGIRVAFSEPDKDPAAGTDIGEVARGKFRVPKFDSGHPAAAADNSRGRPPPREAPDDARAEAGPGQANDRLRLPPGETSDPADLFAEANGKIRLPTGEASAGPPARPTIDAPGRGTGKIQLLPGNPHIEPPAPPKDDVEPHLAPVEEPVEPFLSEADGKIRLPPGEPGHDPAVRSNLDAIARGYGELRLPLGAANGNPPTRPIIDALAGDKIRLPADPITDPAGVPGPEIRVRLGSKPGQLPGKSGNAQIRLPAGKPEDAVPIQLRMRAAGDPELEELVSIAVACARRAEDALQHAREVSWMARRRMSAIAAVTSFGVLAASVGIGVEWYYRSPDAGIRAIASAMSGVSDLQRQTNAQLAEVRSDMAALHDSGSPEQRPTPVQQPVPVVTQGGSAAAAHDPLTRTAELAARQTPGSAAAGTRAVAVAPPVGPAVPEPTRMAEGPAPEPAPVVTRVAAATQVASAAPAMRSAADVAGGPKSSSAADAPASPIEQDQAPPDDQPLPTANAETNPPARAVTPHPVRHYYRPPVRRVIYYRIDPPYVVAQVVANVRRNLYEIFH